MSAATREQSYERWAQVYAVLAQRGPMAASALRAQAGYTTMPGSMYYWRLRGWEKQGYVERDPGSAAAWRATRSALPSYAEFLAECSQKIRKGIAASSRKRKARRIDTAQRDVAPWLRGLAA